MSFEFVLGACVFTAVVAGLTAWIDRWREGRLGAAVPLTIPAARPVPAPRDRAA
ncbi:MAG TPA: hypothetical protein VF010_13710 [Methylomirabilota bacterium]|jgi:hypothetical protein|nr:hypothetical protein [Methylomirabilota bacterium]